MQYVNLKFQGMVGVGGAPGPGMVSQAVQQQGLTLI